MDRALVLKHLAQAEQHVADGEQHLRRQEALIERLTSLGLDTASAIEVLNTLRVTQDLHLDSRARALRELEE